MSRYPFGVLVLLAAGLAPAAEKELHVVALYEGSFDPGSRSSAGAKVKVDRPGKEVVLLVSGHTFIEWEITATPQTKLTKVIFAGYKRQSWKVPPGVEVDEISAESVKQRIQPLSIQADYRIDTSRFRNFVSVSRQYTGLEIASFQGAYRFDHKKPFVVDAVQNDERLSSEFPKLTPPAQVPKFKFEAVHIAYGMESPNARRSFGGWAQFGPAEAGFVPLPSGVKWITRDTKARRHYGIDDHQFSAVDLKAGTTAKIAPPANNFSWLRSLTYDAKRDRVIVLSGRGLFEYTSKNGGAWKQLANNNPLSGYVAVAWQAKTDMLLAFGVERDRQRDAFVPTLYELNPDGSLANSYDLGLPLSPGVLGEYARGDAQLIDVGRDLALLVQNENRDSNTGRRVKSESFLYVINPKSGKVQLAWKE